MPRRLMKMPITLLEMIKQRRMLLPNSRRNGINSLKMRRKPRLRSTESLMTRRSKLRKLEMRRLLKPRSKLLKKPQQTRNSLPRDLKT